MPLATASGAASAADLSRKQHSTYFRAYRYITTLVVLLLSGCSLQSAAIRADFLDYSDAIAETVNKFVVTNILEARDNAPLHFMDIPKINGLLKASASAQASFPFVARTIGSPASVLTNTISPTISVESAPTFEVDHSNLKEFVTGMSSPIDPKWVKYWVDRGLDKRMILLMFFSSAQITEMGQGGGPGQTITLANAPRSAADQLAACARMPLYALTLGNQHGDHCHARTQFELYLRLIDAIHEDFTANAFMQLTTIASTTEAIALKDLAAIDPAKYQVRYFNNEKRYELYFNFAGADRTVHYQKQAKSRGKKSRHRPRRSRRYSLFKEGQHKAAWGKSDAGDLAADSTLCRRSFTGARARSWIRSVHGRASA
jgi:hypothetical protein